MHYDESNPLEAIVIGLCDRYDAATPTAVRERVATLNEEYDLSLGQITKAIGATFIEEPSAVTRIESVTTAQMTPKEATLAGVVLGVLEVPERSTQYVCLADGTDRIEMVLPASTIPMAAQGEVRVFRRLGIKHDRERWAYARSRTEVERYDRLHPP